MLSYPAKGSQSLIIGKWSALSNDSELCDIVMVSELSVFVRYGTTLCLSGPDSGGAAVPLVTS